MLVTWLISFVLGQDYDPLAVSFFFLNIKTARDCPRDGVPARTMIPSCFDVVCETFLRLWLANKGHFVLNHKKMDKHWNNF